MLSFIYVAIVLQLFAVATLGFKPMSRPFFASTKLSMVTIAKGVEFDTVAREWRLKWSADNDKNSLVTANQTLELFKAQLKSLDGIKSVQRIVCGGCLDFKVITALSADKFAAWEAKGFAPEADFINSLKSVPGIAQVETQTYTIETV